MYIQFLYITVKKTDDYVLVVSHNKPVIYNEAHK